MVGGLRVGDRALADPDFSRPRWDKIHYRPHQCRLSRAVTADERNEPIRTDMKRSVSKDIGARDTDTQALNLKHADPPNARH
jgi:hypothetical protein